MQRAISIRFACQLIVLSTLVLLTGCKQSAESVTPPVDDNVSIGSPCENKISGTGPAYLTFYCVTSFDQLAVNTARNIAEFAIQQFDWYIVNNPNTIFSSFSFRSVRTDFAHSVGLSGKGETIAIVDKGFYVNHPELASKI